MKHKPKKNQLVMEALEPRLLFSADLDGGLVSGALASHSALLNPALVDNHVPAVAGVDDTRAASAIRQELVLVDTDTPDYQQLIDDLLTQEDASRHLEVILLDNTRDGIHQVTEILSNYRGLDAVHLISHGEAGSVDLGGSVLEFDSIKANTGLIQSWGEAFSANGDLLIYGCDLAATASGQGMVDALGRLTGADVAASDDLTGSAALGGDWELEYRVGSVESQVAVSTGLQQSWSNVLASAPSGTVYTDEGTTDIGAGVSITMLVNGSSTETVVTGAGGAYAFTVDTNGGDAVALFIDNDATYKATTVTVSDGVDLSTISLYADHIITRHDNGGSLTIADMDAALGGFTDPEGDVLYSVSGGNLTTNVAGTELFVPLGHTFAPGGDMTVDSVEIQGTVIGGSNTFNVAENWDSAAGSWLSNVSTVNLTGTGTINSAGDSFYNLTTGAASQVTTLTSDLTVRGVLTIADSTGTLTDSGVGYDITVTGTGTPFVNNGAAVTAKNFIYLYPTDATITAAGGTYNVTESLWIAGSGTGSGTTYQLNGALLVSGGLDVYATSFGVSILDTMGHSITANGLQVSNSAFQVGFLYANNSTIDINGDVDFLNSVTTVVDLGSSDFSVSGDWTNTSNTFNAGTSTVTMDGVNQQLTGSTAFYNLTKVEGSNDGTDSVLTFDNTATQTINGALTLTGLDADDRINLVSNVPGNQWSINLAAPATHALNYIVVTDSDASGSDPGQLTINPANSFSGGNNIGWFGATAGDDAYTVDEGSTTNLDLSANDSDADGLDLASIVITSGPTNGSIIVNANGTVDYTHDDSETVADSFTYTINDTLGEISNIATVTLTVNPVNEAPVVNDQAFSIDENRPMNANVGTLAVTDPDTGDTPTWSITGGTGATAFSILSPSGLIRVADPSQINFETNPILTLDIQVEDAGGLIDTATITININDLNERPTLNDVTLDLDENSANDTPVVTMTGTDPDTGDSLTYSIVGGNIGNAFKIDPVTGEITVNDTSALDYEAIGNASNPAYARQTGAANPFSGVYVAGRSAPAFVDIDGDGDMDAFIGDYNGNIHFFENTGNATSPNYVAVSGAGNPFDGIDTGTRSTPAFGDIDNDGDLDVFVGDRYGGISFFENVGDSTNPSFLQMTGADNPLDGQVVPDMAAPALIDIDGDGDLDAFVGQWFGSMNYFENTGDASNAVFTRQTGAANPLNGVSAPNYLEWQPRPTFADLDADGDYDAFIGLKNGSTEYWENTGDAATPVFTQQTGDANPLRTANSGGNGEAAPAFVDYDGDGDLDLFYGNSLGTINYYENKPVFNLTVRAQDTSGLADNAQVRIDLSDVNEGPSDIDLSNNLIDEHIDTTGGYSVGTLSTTDEDGGETHNYTIIGGADQAKFTIGGAGLDELILTDGVLDFETQNSYQVTLRVTDSGTPGLTYDETFTITVNDLNDAPVLTGAVDLTTIDEDPVTNNGTLVSALIAGQVTDADAAPVEGIAVVGVDNSNGSWEYTINGGGTWLTFGSPGTATARLLAADANTLVRFVPNTNWNGTVSNGLSFHAWDQSSGSNGGTDDLTGNTGVATPFSTATAASSIVVNPTPDAPVIGGDDTGSVTEDAGVVAGYLIDTGSLTIADPDAGEDNYNAESLAGTYGSLNIDTVGNWNYTTDNSQAAIQNLPAGATLTDTLTVTTADGTTHDIVITITGTNDAAVIGGTDTGAVTEDVDPDLDGLLETGGTLTITDIDTGEAGFTPGTLAGTYGSVTLDAAGNWSYAADNTQAAIQSLPAGAILTDTITVTAVDGTPHDVVITITGTNDAAVIGGVDSGAVTEDVDPDLDGLLETGGALTITDTDTGEAGFTAGTLSGTYGSLTLDAAGNWGYAAGNAPAVIQTLAGGATLTDTFTVTSLDGTTHTVVITITGTNDAPVANNDNPAIVNAGTSVTIDLAANDTDIDDAIDLTSIIIMSGPTHGTVTIVNDGTVIYTHDGSATSITDSFTYAILDASGAVSNTATVTLVIDPADIQETAAAAAEPIQDEAPIDDEEAASDPPLREEAPVVKEAQVLPKTGLGQIEPGKVTVKQLAAETPENHVVDNIVLISQDNPGIAQRTLQGMIDKLERFNHELWDVLDAMKNEMSSDDRSDDSRINLFAKSATGLTLTLSIGAVSWAIRGASVMASMLSSMPMWKGFDPLPLLSAKMLSRSRDETASDTLSDHDRIAEEHAAKLLDASEPMETDGQHQDDS